MSRPTHNVRLVSPIDVEGVWKELATTLPELAALFASRRYDRDPRSALPALRGPKGDSPRRYECSDPDVSAHVDLRSVDRDGQTFRSIILTVMTVRYHGMIVLTLWDSNGGPAAIDQLSLECDDDALDAVLDVLRSHPKLAVV